MRTLGHAAAKWTWDGVSKGVIVLEPVPNSPQGESGTVILIVKVLFPQTFLVTASSERPVGSTGVSKGAISIRLQHGQLIHCACSSGTPESGLTLVGRASQYALWRVSAPPQDDSQSELRLAIRAERPSDEGAPAQVSGVFRVHVDQIAYYGENGIRLDPWKALAMKLHLEGCADFDRGSFATTSEISFLWTPRSR